jgi:beta-glucosidase
MVYVYQSYLLGLWPPQKKSFFTTKRVIDNLINVHIASYKAIHQTYKKNKIATPSVGIAANLQFFLPCKNNLKNKFASYLRNKLFNFYFIDKIAQQEKLDFIGVNYYTRNIVELHGLGLKNIFLDNCRQNHHPALKNSLGWDIYPEGLCQLLLAFKKYNLPIAITENGICTEDDNLRWDFILEHLKKISLALDKGVNIFAYLYWSLLDNFEWDKGFTPRFGLIAVDYSSYQRTVRESAKKFALVCKNNQLD